MKNCIFAKNAMKGRVDIFDVIRQRSLQKREGLHFCAVRESSAKPMKTPAKGWPENNFPKSQHSTRQVGISRRDF